MRRISGVFLSIVVALSVTLTSGTAAAANAADTVREIGDEFAAAAEASPAMAQAEVVKVLDKWFSVRSMALAALPEAFRDKADAGYVSAYRDHLAREFVKRTLRAGEGALNPIGVRPVGPLSLVGTQVIEDGRVVRMIEFYMQRVGASYRVNNVAVENVLITAEQQKDFRPHLISGDIPGLIAYLNGAR